MTFTYHENYLFLNGFQSSVICVSDSGTFFCDNSLMDNTENVSVVIFVCYFVCITESSFMV